MTTIKRLVFLVAVLVSIVDVGHSQTKKPGNVQVSDRRKKPKVWTLRYPKVIVIGDSGTITLPTSGGFVCRTPMPLPAAAPVRILQRCDVGMTDWPSVPRNGFQLVRIVSGAEKALCHPAGGCHFHAALGFNVNGQPNQFVEIGMFYSGQTLVFDFPLSDFESKDGKTVSQKANSKLAVSYLHYSGDGVGTTGIDDADAKLDPKDTAKETEVWFTP